MSSYSLDFVKWKQKCCFSQSQRDGGFVLVLVDLNEREGQRPGRVHGGASFLRGEELALNVLLMFSLNVNSCDRDIIRKLFSLHVISNTKREEHA